MNVNLKEHFTYHHTIVIRPIRCTGVVKGRYQLSKYRGGILFSMMSIMISLLGTHSICPNPVDTSFIVHLIVLASGNFI